MNLISGLGNWLDDRTGYKQLLHESLYENIPGGSRWIYVTGSMLVLAFVTQVITGLFLWMCYSPGSQNAWESVYYIQNELQGGWFLRGVHHVMAQMMVVLLPIHLLQVVLCKAYVAPREINYWLGLVLMLLVLALGLTGYLLPWDQKGYWATKVATELASLPPGGAYIQKLVVGGSEYGHYTLTRFFALHAGVLPILLTGVLVLHLAMFRKHGITAKSSARRDDEYFWPMQVLKDSIACLVMMGVVVGYVVFEGGAELGPPAEPTEAYGAARPEWYYLFLFQLLKHAPNEFIGAIVIPGVVMLFLFLLPLIARIKFLHVINVVVLLALMISAGYLTYEAMHHDNYALQDIPAPEETEALKLHNIRKEGSQQYLLAKRLAEHEYERVKELIQFHGIGKEGVSTLVHNDPEIQGPRIFMRNCASCHSYLNDEGEGIPGPPRPRNADGTIDEAAGGYGAPNLYGIGSSAWFRKFLDPATLVSDEVFGLTSHNNSDDSEMVSFVQDDLAELDDSGKQNLDAIIAALAAEAQLPSQQESDRKAQADGTLAQGRTAMAETFENYACTDCHKFRDEGDLGSAPDLTGHSSYEWLYAFISNPDHERFYESTNDRMPAYAPNPDEPLKNLLTHHELDMLVRWLRGDDRQLGGAKESSQESEAAAGDASQAASTE